MSGPWPGRLAPKASGTYTLTLFNTDSARLYLDGNLLIEHNPGHPSIQALMNDQESISKKVQIELKAGQTYDLTFEFSRTPGLMIAVTALSYYLPVSPADTIARAVELARHSDVALVFAGMPTGFETEGKDRPNMDLPGPQVELIRAVAAANPRTVVVLNAGAPVAMPWLDAVPAVLEAYYPGQEGGSAVMDVLWGDANPSGKLSVTFPKRLEDNPAYLYYPGLREVYYGEGVFVGYRWYDPDRKVLGKRIRYISIPPVLAGVWLRRNGLSGELVKSLVQTFDALRRNEYAAVTDDAERVTGHKPRSYETWCRENIAAFQ